MELAPAARRIGGMRRRPVGRVPAQRASQYPAYYGFEHTQPALLADAVFGLPELHRDELKSAQLVATPGCHVTAATLALRPLVAAGLIEPHGVVVDTLTGIRAQDATRPTPTSSPTSTRTSSPTGCSTIGTHRRWSRRSVRRCIFTPHIVPMSRGLLATCYARPSGACHRRAVLESLESFYAAEPFVAVTAAPPATKSVLGSNAAHVSARFDERTGTVITMCAIDNLTKGASGGAVQSANVALGLDETAGLTAIGLAP